MEKNPVVKQPELKELKPNIFAYLSMLVARDSLLFVKNTLRGRKYSNGDIAHFEQTVTTQDINGLIDDGYLFICGRQGEYNVLQVHPIVESHIRNFNKNNPVKVDRFNYMLQFYRKLEKGERAELLRGANHLTFNFSTKELMKKVYTQGYTFDTIFTLTGTNLPSYLFIDTKKERIYQVFPREVVLENELKKKESSSVKTPIQYEISDKRIRIVSEEASTSFVNFTKQEYPRYQDVVETYALARRYLRDYGVKTKGVLEVSRFINDIDKVQTYNEFLLHYDLMFSKLLKSSRELVKVGIVQGGFDNNPQYKDAWDKQNALSSLTKEPTVKRFLHLYSIFQEIVEKHDDGTLVNMTALSF